MTMSTDDLYEREEEEALRELSEEHQREISEAKRIRRPGESFIDAVHRARREAYAASEAASNAIAAARTKVDPITGRIGGWMQTHSGKAWYHADPRVEDVDIWDIAHALSNICRFGGHTNRFYSVAEHSIYVSMVVPPQFAFQALMHDATEAYVVDVPRPLKHMLAGYAEFEDKAWQVIARKFGLPLELDPSVKLADNTVLLAERDALLLEPPIPWTWAAGLTPANVKIECLTPNVAKDFFLRRFHQLGGSLR